MAKHFASVSNTNTGGTFSEERKSSPMIYKKIAIPPETLEEHSIYPVGDRLRKVPQSEESLDSQMGPERGYSRNPELNLQYQVRNEITRLWVEKHSKTAEDTDRLDRDTGHQSGVVKSDGDPTIREEIPNSRRVLHESLEWHDDSDAENLDKGLTVFADTPRDEGIVEERGEWLLPPWDVPDPIHAPSLTALSSMTEWDPEADIDFQTEARAGWSDCRFKVPQTPADIESLQKALEITRMDFWIRSPNERYPEDLSQYKKESYGSQHRRLQHAFCIIWRDLETEAPPALYRLPEWMFGFEYCYWKPSSWGHNRRSNAYNEGLAAMAAEKNEKSLENLRYQDWKAKLKEVSGAPTLADFAPSRRSVAPEEIERGGDEGLYSVSPTPDFII